MLKQVQHDEMRKEEGVLQIIVWLGCLYLVLKGLQLLQVGLMAPEEKTSVSLIGNLGIILSVGGAVLFIWMANNQVENSGLNGLTSSNLAPSYSEEGATSADGVDAQAAADDFASDAMNAGYEAANAAEEAMKEANEAMAEKK